MIGNTVINMVKIEWGAKFIVFDKTELVFKKHIPNEIDIADNFGWFLCYVFSWLKLEIWIILFQHNEKKALYFGFISVYRSSNDE